MYLKFKTCFYILIFEKLKSKIVSKLEKARAIRIRLRQSLAPGGPFTGEGAHVVLANILSWHLAGYIRHTERCGWHVAPSPEISVQNLSKFKVWWLDDVWRLSLRVASSHIMLQRTCMPKASKGALTWPRCRAVGAMTTSTLSSRKPRSRPTDPARGQPFLGIVCNHVCLHSLDWTACDRERSRFQSLYWSINLQFIYYH